MRTAAIALGLLTALGVGVFIATKSKNARTQATEDTAAAVSQQEKVDALELHQRELERDLAAERQRTRDAAAAEADARKKLEETKTELDAVRPKEPDPAATPDPQDGEDPENDPENDPEAEGAPAYHFDDFDESLAEIDWKEIGENMSAMPGLIAELAEHISAGKPLEELPPESLAGIGRHNAPLLQMAMKLNQAGVPGTGIPGTFSHPAVMVNAVEAALVALEMPLTEAQSKRIGALGTDFVARDKARLAAYDPDDDPGFLAKMVDEAELKHAFFAKLYGILTTEQHEALRPPVIRGRLRLDIYCESVIWVGRAGPLLFTDRDDLTTNVGSWIVSRASLPGETHEQARTVTAQWVSDLPDELLAREADSLATQGMMHVEQVNATGRNVVALVETLITELALDDEAATKARAVPGTIVLYRKAPEPVDGGE